MERNGKPKTHALNQQENTDPMLKRNKLYTEIHERDTNPEQCGVKISRFKRKSPLKLAACSSDEVEPHYTVRGDSNKYKMYSR